ncbi:FecR family protein [Chitinophagaceae bacterium LWZ2-11]
MAPEKIAGLIEKYLNGNATDEERSELLGWYRSVDHTNIEIPVSSSEEKEAIQNRILKNILSNIKREKTVGIGWGNEKRAGRYKWMAAAILLLVVGTVFLIRTISHPKRDNSTTPGAMAESSILPGSNKAILTLADGSNISLDSLNKETIANQGSATIVKQGSGCLKYEAANASGNNTIPTNSITTPKGGQYAVVLSDGTKVWLNADSKLTFPTAFTGNQRNVTLKGEAYFEVAKNKEMPFVVKVDETEIKVLGTHFDIMAYDDEAAIATTLLEGSVQMSHNKQTTLLKPGEQGSYNKSQNNLTVHEADGDAAIAWKNGYYYFNRTDLQTVMRQIARWYNVEVEYKGNVPKDEIVGRKIPRSADVSEVLHIMELIGIHFKIEGRKIIVLQ